MTTAARLQGALGCAWSQLTPHVPPKKVPRKRKDEAR
jgi:hypothetical protein